MGHADDLTHHSNSAPGAGRLRGGTRPRPRFRAVRAVGRAGAVLVAVALLGRAGAGHAFAASPFPLWAYGVTTAPQPGDKHVPQNPPSRALRPNQDPAEQTRLRRVAGSTAQYSVVDIRDLSNVIDWFPGDHPPMTPILKNGPAKAGAEARGCASCHLPNGRGRPENAPLAGLPVNYFVQQLQDFRRGLRVSSDPRKPNVPTMALLTHAMTDDEMQEAAAYFNLVEWSRWTRVVETDRVPKTRIVGNLFLATETARTEPIAGRIIEVPEDEEQSEVLRNPHSGFVAYVPRGSLARGKHLVTTGGSGVVGGTGKTVACLTCHGPDLMGLIDVPPIAGRSPSYLVRQMYDLQTGARHGPQAINMQPVVANLTASDLVDIAAYVASLPEEEAIAKP